MNDEQAELVRRYGLSTDELRRVHGGTWGEKCADAARLAELRDPQSVRERALRHLRELQDEARS